MIRTLTLIAALLLGLAAPARAQVAPMAGAAVTAAAAAASPTLSATQASGDFTNTLARNITRPMLQKCIDGLPRADGVIHIAPQGGWVRLPEGVIDLKATPLYVDGMVRLSGITQYATELRYSGDGAAVRLRCYAGHGYQMGSRISDLTINSLNGDGIAFDSGIATSNYVRIEHVKVSSKVTAIRLRPEHDNAYMVTIDDVLVDDAGEMALDLKANCVTIRDLYCYINHPMSGPAMVRLSGGIGSCTGGRLEGQPGIPARLIDGGDWDLIGDYVEVYVKDGYQQVIEHAQVNQSFLRWIRTDCKYRVGNGATLNVSFPNDGAITPSGIPTDPAGCFDLAGGGQLCVTQRSPLVEQVVTPATTQATTRPTETPTSQPAVQPASAEQRANQ